MVPPPVLLLLLAFLSAALGLSCAGGAAAATPGAVSGTSLRWSVRPDSAASGAGSGWRTVSVSSPAPRSVLVPLGPTAGASLTVSQPPPAVGVAAARPALEALPADATAVAAAPKPPPYLIRPSLGGGVPTGYVGGWGDYYIAGSAATPGKLRNGVVDASINMGFGLGDPVRTLGLEVNWGIGSIKNLNANGSVSFAAGRILVNRPDLQVAVAGGLLDAYSYGNEAGQPSVNGYGAVTAALPLRPSDPDFQQVVQFSAGGGGNSFSAIDGNFQTTSSGFFAAAGIELTPYLGLSVGQSTRSTNVNLSFIPFRTLPIFVNLLAADVFDATPFGTVGVLTVGWGDSLRRGFFTQ